MKLQEASALLQSDTILVFYLAKAGSATRRETDTERGLLWQGISTEGLKIGLKRGALLFPTAHYRGNEVLSYRHAASAGTQAVEAMATGDSRTVEECFLGETVSLCFATPFHTRITSNEPRPYASPANLLRWKHRKWRM